MLIDEAIQYYEEMSAEEQRKISDGEVRNHIGSFYIGGVDKRSRLSAEYKQLAEWLNELKHLKSEKEKMIDTLSEKMADIGMCPNERDIILRIVGGTTNYEVHCNTDCNHTGCKSYHYATKELPSVKPERKKGKWINIREGNRADCDQCGQSGRAWMNFCFDCGAEMEGQDDRK